MNKTEAFKQFGAVPKNTVWSVSAFNEKNELVLSLWFDFFKTDKGYSIYRDSVSRWKGLGNAEFRENLIKAYNDKLPIKAVITHTNNIECVKNGEDASKFKNRFSIKRDWLGEITMWDGDQFEITFSKISR